MGLGGTAKKIQKVADMAEDLYGKLNEQREQLQSLRETVEHTGERVDAIETELAEQRALLRAIADEQGVDTDEVIADAVIDDAEALGDEGTEVPVDEAED
ncbi:MAG: DUF5798 family protein [Haloarculaceae archaeon]